MNAPKGARPEQTRPDDDTPRGTPPVGGPTDQTMGGTDNTTADNVEEARRAARDKAERGEGPPTATRGSGRGGS